MEALGVDIQMPIDGCAARLSEVGIGFLFAQRFHSSMKHVMPARTQLKIRTVFNMLGPLANPACRAISGCRCFSPEMMELVAQALVGLKMDRALVVHGEDGLDEISISAPTRFWRSEKAEFSVPIVTPESFGVAPATLESLRGGDASARMQQLSKASEGERDRGVMSC